MADISVMNVGGTDYNIKDSTSRTNSTKAMSLPAYYETGNTASQAYSIVGTPINWKGTLYYTKTTVAKGATWAVGTNLTAATNLGKLVRNIKTYVGSDSKLHFVDLTGADTALNFSRIASVAFIGTAANFLICGDLGGTIKHLGTSTCLEVYYTSSVIGVRAKKACTVSWVAEDTATTITQNYNAGDTIEYLPLGSNAFRLFIAM